MDQHKQSVLSSRYKKVLENLQKNGMEAVLLASRAEVLDKLSELIPAGAVVAHGGSMTLVECGAVDWLKAQTELCYLDRDKLGLSLEERSELMRQALLLTFICRRSTPLPRLGNFIASTVQATGWRRCFMARNRLSWWQASTRLFPT